MAHRYGIGYGVCDSISSYPNQSATFVEFLSAFSLVTKQKIFWTVHQ